MAMVGVALVEISLGQPIVFRRRFEWQFPHGPFPVTRALQNLSFVSFVSVHLATCDRVRGQCASFPSHWEAESRW